MHKESSRIQQIWNILFLSLCLSLPFGQIGAIPFGNGITMYLHDGVLIVILLFFLSHVAWVKRRTFPARLVRPLSLFLVVACVSLVVQINTVPLSELLRGSLYLVRFMGYSLIPLCFYWSGLSTRNFMKGLSISGILFVVTGIAQYIWYPSLRPLIGGGWDEHFGRLFGTLFDPNYMGMVLTSSFFVLLYFLLRIRLFDVTVKNSILWSSLILTLCSIILTFSRSAYLALFSGIIIFSFRMKAYLFLAAMVGIIVFLYIAVPKDYRDVNRLTRTVSSFARIENWQQSITYVSEKPLLGYGFNLLRVRIRENRSIEDRGIYGRDTSGLNSSVLFAFATTGIIGGVCYLWWLFKQLSVFVSLRDTSLGAIGLSTLLSSFIFSWFNNGLFYPWILIWLMTLFCAALVSQKKSK